MDYRGLRSCEMGNKKARCASIRRIIYAVCVSARQHASVYVSAHRLRCWLLSRDAHNTLVVANHWPRTVHLEKHTNSNGPTLNSS
jgi:hypothetical protein